MSATTQSAKHEKQLNTLGKILDDFKPWLEDRYGRQAANKVASDAMWEYMALLPGIPNLGNDLQARLFFDPTPRYLAVYRAMINLGYSIEETGQVVYAMGTAAVEAMPRPLRRLLGWLWFNSLLRILIRRKAAKTHRSHHPQGYIIDFVDGSGKGFDYGVDYQECATLKYLDSNDALPLTPFICAIDKPASEGLGWGLRRETTLAAGCPRCEFRFTKGGPTIVPIPAGLN